MSRQRKGWAGLSLNNPEIAGCAIRDWGPTMAVMREETLGEELEVTATAEWLKRLYVAAPEAGLRREDLKKAVEVTALLNEIRRWLGHLSSSAELVMMDAAAGKSYVGLLAAKLLFEPLKLPAKVILIERDPSRVAKSLDALRILDTRIPVECRTGDVGSEDLWPAQPSLVTALHACGVASDRVIERAIGSRAKTLLLVPCCLAKDVPAAARAECRADREAVPRQAPVRRRYVQACVDSERTLRLEAAGYHTEVVELVSPTVTPQNLLWRARRVCEPVRMAKAQSALNKWLSSG